VVFNPAQLTPAASLNRVLLADGTAGSRPAFELLSARALHDLIVSRSPELGLSPVQDAIVAFNRLLESPGPRSPAAEAVAETFVRRMALLVATLKTGPAAARAARPEWDASYWQAWSEVRRIRLGGGMLSGNLGRYVESRLPEVLREVGLDVDVRLSAFPQALPLVGAARRLPSPASMAAVLDFGHTSIKRAAALYSGGERLDGLTLLKPLASPDVASHGSTLEIEQLGRRVADVIASTWLEVQSIAGHHPLSPEVVCSVACYLRDGQPYPESTGTYAALRALSPSIARWLSGQVSVYVGSDIKVTLVHDGTAAGRAYAGEPNAAVIMFGTALGVGFAAQDVQLCEMSPTFAVRPAIG
jgi:hypothetical protein